MPDNQDSVNRRDFMVKTAAVAGALGAAKELFAKPAKAAATGKVIGANDRINVGVIGVGGRGFYLAGQYAAIGERTSACKVVAVADVYEKRKRLAVEKFKCDGYLDYREIINRADIDAVVGRWRPADHPSRTAGCGRQGAPACACAPARDSAPGPARSGRSAASPNRCLAPAPGRARHRPRPVRRARTAASSGRPRRCRARSARRPSPWC